MKAFKSRIRQETKKTLYEELSKGSSLSKRRKEKLNEIKKIKKLKKSKKTGNYEVNYIFVYLFIYLFTFFVDLYIHRNLLTFSHLLME